MEKMNGDMLEMILNSENSRLTERLTKYMIYQASLGSFFNLVAIIHLVAYHTSCGISYILVVTFLVVYRTSCTYRIHLNTSCGTCIIIDTT